MPYDHVIGIRIRIAAWIVSLYCTWFQKGICSGGCSRHMCNNWTLGSDSLWVFPIVLAGCIAWASGAHFPFQFTARNRNRLKWSVPCYLFPWFHPAALHALPRMGVPLASCHRFVLEHRLFEMEELRSRSLGEETWTSAPGGFCLYSLYCSAIPGTGFPS